MSRAVVIALGADERDLLRGLDASDDALNAAADDFKKAGAKMDAALAKVADAADEAGSSIGDVADAAATDLSTLGGAVGDIAGGVEKFGKTFGLSEAAITRVSEVSEGLSTALMAGAGIADTASVATERLSGLNLKAAALKAKDTVATIAQTVASKAQAAAAKAAAAAQWAMNAAMSANPIGLVIAALVALVAGFVIAYKKSEKFRKIVDKVFAGIKKVIGKVANWFTTKIPSAFTKVFDKVKNLAGKFAGFITETIPNAFRTVVGFLLKWNLYSVLARILGKVREPINKLVEFVKKLPKRISDGAAGMWDGLKTGLRDVLNGIIGLWNSIDFGIHITVPDWVPKVGGKGINIDDIFPDIPTLANGGIVDRPTLALIGEAGPEAVVPLNGRYGLGNTYKITVHAPVGASSADIGRTITRHIEAYERAGGRRRTA